MKLIPSLGEITHKGKEAFKRFPITLSWSIIGTLFTLWSVEIETFDKIFYGKVILTFILGISWLIATRFFEEQFKTDKEWIFLITLSFIFVFYVSLPNEGRMSNTNITRFVLYLLAGHLLIFVAPFLLKWNKNAYFNYIKSIFIAIVRSLFFSLVLYLGVALALLAFKHLFNIDVDGKRFFQIFIICLGIVNTWMYLADFPKKIHQKTIVNYTKALEVLVKYVLIPLVILYLIILYAYSLKIVLNWNLPKGWVSYLVVALSFLGFLIQILISPIQQTTDSRAIRRFYPWFYVLLLPLNILLFVAIFRRISEYGFTENRYFVLILACYILGMTAYMLISKNKKTNYFPLSLAVLALLTSFGFWSAFSVSTKSQVHQFKKVYHEIKAQNFTTTYEKKNQLQSIIRYLSNKNETDKITDILGYNPDEVFKSKNKWDIPYKLMDSLNITIDDKTTIASENKYYNLDEFNTIINTKGYDFFKRVYFNSFKDNRKEYLGYEFILLEKSNTISIWKNNSEIGILDCTSLLDSLDKQSKNNGIDPDLMTIEKILDSLKVKIVFVDISMDKNNQKNYIYSANGYVLIKENGQ
ncbi:uncharacterized protein DUF4153 [Tenacibaculum adriaticum]|uniref:Uncharacterized protein DUF4153 n=1 Tax=Tenacibaculum adriaticum TaxID=413713 RepID=A0A5S5DVM1_9FLAO|nr:DUF4153 domain-containing protein [Tenacibaculum adriaticum]TYP99885.1 uncharacterized protein DUF4153 [Tenacibaculum adriaticum]